MKIGVHEVDYLFVNSIGYKCVADALLFMSVKDYKRRKYKFIKENNLQVLKYKGNNVWGDEIFENLVDLHNYFKYNYVEDLKDIKTDLFYTDLKKLKNMNILTEKDGQIKWTGSVDFQSITNFLLQNNENY